MPQLDFGHCDLCGRSNIYSGHRLAKYELLGNKLTSSCKYCLAVQCGAKKRAAALERPAEEAMATAVKGA